MTDKNYPNTEEQDERSGSRYEDNQQQAWDAYKREVKQSQREEKAARIHEAHVRLLNKKTLTGAAVVLVLCYGAFAVHYGNHFYPGTRIYDLPADNMTASAVQQQVEDKVGNYSLYIHTRGTTDETVSAASIDLQYDNNGGLEKALKEQKSVLWPFMLLTRKKATTDIGMTFDETRLESLLGDMECFDPELTSEPQDAYVGETAQGYQVIPEVPGTMLDREKTCAVIREAIEEGKKEVSLQDEGCYLEPSVTAQDPSLNEEAAARNKIMGADITLTFGDREEKLDALAIMDFVRESADGSYSFSDEAIWNYTADLAAKYDTLGSERVFNTSTGLKVTLYGGDYGWQMDQEETAQTIKNDLMEKKVETIHPVYSHSALNRNADDIGSTYIEISIADQTMWAYKNGELIVETPVVTGNPHKEDTATPANGVWEIDYKTTDYTLVGETYRQPVSYWMPFNNNVGIHDLQARAVFGGTIYQYAGSHGCINTPLEAVRTIYETFDAGTPVIVYDGKTAIEE